MGPLAFRAYWRAIYFCSAVTHAGYFSLPDSMLESPQMWNSCVYSVWYFLGVLLHRVSALWLIHGFARSAPESWIVS